VVVENIIKGDSVNEVLQYVQFNGRELIDRLQAAVDTAIRERRIDHKQAGAFVHFYEDALNGYTYLEEPDGE
jgi:arginine decarboxylase